MTVTDHETTVLDELDVEVPCDNPRCDDAADWAMRWHGMPCCAPLALVCAECLEESRTWLSRAQRESAIATCKQHGTDFQIADCSHRRHAAAPLTTTTRRHTMYDTIRTTFGVIAALLLALGALAVILVAVDRYLGSNAAAGILIGVILGLLVFVAQWGLA